MARVAMNGWGSRPLTYRRPFTIPTASPVASMAATERAAERWSRQTIDPTTALSERVAPTDRSMPRVRITSSWPRARIEMTADCFITLPAFPSVRKTSESRLSTTIRSTRITTGPAWSARMVTLSARPADLATGAGAELSAVPVTAVPAASGGSPGRTPSSRTEASPRSVRSVRRNWKEGKRGYGYSQYHLSYMIYPRGGWYRRAMDLTRRAGTRWTTRRSTT